MHVQMRPPVQPGHPTVPYLQASLKEIRNEVMLKSARKDHDLKGHVDAACAIVGLLEY